jgi:hypothetical protein
MFASTLEAEQLYANGAPSAERDDRGELMIDPRVAPPHSAC